MSCTRIRSLIDHQLQLREAGSSQQLAQIRIHTETCPHCAAYLEQSEQLVQLLECLPEAKPAPDLCQRVMQQLTEAGPRPVHQLAPIERLQPAAPPQTPADSTAEQNQVAQLEHLLRTLPEIKPSPDLCQQVIERLQTLPTAPAAEPAPRRARIAPPGLHLLRGLSYLLAAAALVLGSTVQLPAAWLDRLTQRPTPLDLPSLLPTDPSSILLAVATLLLLLSIRTSPTPAPQPHGIPPRSP